MKIFSIVKEIRNFIKEVVEESREIGRTHDRQQKEAQERREQFESELKEAQAYIDKVGNAIDETKAREDFEKDFQKKRENNDNLKKINEVRERMKRDMHN